MRAGYAALLTLLAGCSVIGLETPRAGKRCDRSYSLPIADAVIASSTAAGSVGLFLYAAKREREAIANNESTNDGYQIARGWARILLAPTLGYAASALLGRWKVCQCRALPLAR
jgi:hypothetical protein